MHKPAARSAFLLIVLCALGLGCAPLAPAWIDDAEDPDEGLPEPPPPRDRSPLPCSTREAEPSDLPWESLPSGDAHLHASLLPPSAASPCLPHRRLLDSVPRRQPLHGSSTRVDGLWRFAPHFALDAAPIGLGPWAIVGGDSGLWLFDLVTMTRRVWLHPEPVSSVAASDDGRSVAFLTRSAGATEGTLIVASFPALRQLHRFEGVPLGRLRISNTDARLTIATGQKSVVLIDPEREPPIRRLETAEDVADALPYPGEVDQLIYVGDENRVVRWDLATEREVSHSTETERALFGFRDLNALALDAERARILVGGDDSRVRVYGGLFTSAPRQVAKVSVAGNVSDLGCCREGRFVVATTRGQLAWLDETGEFLWELPPLLPEILGGEVRVRPTSGEEVLGTMAGRVFLWQPRRPLVVPRGQGVRPSRVDAGPDDSLVVTTPASRVVVHRAPAESGPEVLTEVLGELDWFDVRSILRAPDGSRALLGATPRGSGVALVPRGGALRVMGEVEESADGLELRWESARGEYVLLSAAGEPLALRAPPE